MKEMAEKFRKIGIIPVVVIDDADDALPLGEALMKGGLPAAEVTFRTDAAEEALRRMAAGCPDMLLGAGTVLTPEQADRAMAAGANFIVSPGLNPDVAKHCLDKGYPFAPGVQTPSEMEQALSMGFDFVKFFPAEAAGGLPMIKAVAAPYTRLSFMPTGGISAGNVKSYLEYERVVCCGGSWMVKGDLIRGHKFDEIERLAREAADIVRDVRREKKG